MVYTYKKNIIGSLHVIEGVVGTGLADDAIQREVGHAANEDGGDEHVLQPVIDQDFRLWRFHRREERHEGPDRL